MPTINASKQFNVPIDRVWSTVTDLHNAAERISAIKKMEVLTDGPVGPGTRFRETRVIFRKEATEEMEITGWDPPREYAVEAESCGCHYRTIVALAPEGDGTRVDMTFIATPQSFMARLMSPLCRPMLSACRKAFEKDLEDLRRHLEGDTAASNVQPA